MEYKTLMGKPFDMDVILELAQSGKKIGLIKELRSLSGMGLGESKDAIEMCMVGPINSNGYHDSYDYNALEALYAKYCEPTGQMEKEEFMNIIENAVDNMEALHFENMLDAVETLCLNIRTNGGLEAITKKNARFLRGI
jgi:hypothetical protein